MSVQARVNNLFGGSDAPVSVTATSAGTLTIPATATWINVTAASSVKVGGASTAVFSMPSFSRGRMLIFYNNGTTNIVTFHSTDTSAMGSTTTIGFMDLGGDVALEPTDVLAVYVRPDGSAVRVFNTNN